MAAKKQEAPKKTSGSALAGLDVEVSKSIEVIESAMKKVGGDIARGLSLKAIEKINEAVDLLAKAEREDS